MKKFALMKNDSIYVEGDTELYRIKALIDFGDVSAGDLGGYIAKEENLSQEGNAWVYGDAQVYDNAYVGGNAKVSDNASVYGNARVLDDAHVYGDAIVFEKASVFGKVYGESQVCGSANVYSDARVYGEAFVFGNAIVCDEARVYEEARIYGKARICDDASVCGKAIVCGDARICEEANVSGKAEIFGDVVIADDEDYMVFENGWSSERSVTYTKPNKMWKEGSFYGTDEELVNKAYEENEEIGKEYASYVQLVEDMERAENSRDLYSLPQM